ncbi:MAG: diguanylate cyclase [Streptosporangiales bacterium]|nr:diguanylate cyclase [Streptosporangiales bacterium]
MTRRHGDDDRRGDAPVCVAHVVDDETAAAVTAELAPDGYRVSRVTDLHALRSAVARERSAIAVVDLAGSGGDLRQVLRELRGDHRTARVPLLVLVPALPTSEELLPFGGIADDYVVRPWTPGELRTRLAWVVRRGGDLSPMAALTGLPGSALAREELTRRLSSGETFAYCRLDLDGFAAFNEVYGYGRGDQLILVLAAALRRVTADLSEQPFVAHVDGGDFVLICAAEQARPACRDIADMFEADSEQLYDEGERVRGALRVVDRRGHAHDVPFVTVSAGVATNEHRTFAGPHQVADVSREMLAFAKRSTGSSIGVDRRKT